MANGTELAQAYVQIIPSFEGVTQELKKGIEPAADKAGEDAGEKGGKSFLGKLGKVVAGGAAAAFAGVSAAAAGLVSGVKDLAAYGDNIDKMSQKLGMSAEAYQEWDAIMKHSGTSIDSMTSSMKTLANAAAGGSDAFEQLGLSQEDIASMNQEQLFSATITALQNMEDGTERTALASKLLGKGATELGALLNTSAEDTEAMRQRVHELGGVMSDDAVKASAAFQDSLQDMQTAFSGLGRGLLSNFLPGITTVMDGLTEIFAGNGDTGVAKIKEGISGIVTQITSTMPQLMQLGVGIITSLSSAIIQNLPQLMSAGMDALTQFTQGIITQLPTLLETGLTMIVTLGEGIAEQLPSFIDTALEGIMGLVDTLMDNLGPFIESGIDIISSLLDGIIEAIPKIVDYIPQLITTVINGIVQNLPRIVQSGIDLIVSLVNGLIKAIPQLVASIPQIIKAIWETIKNTDWLELGITIIKSLINGIISMVKNIGQAAKDLISEAWNAIKNTDWLQLGKDMIDGIKNGVKNAASKLASSVKEAAKGALNGVKKFLGIASPSKVFEAQVGEMIPLGAAEGIKNEADSVKDAVKQMSKEAIGSFDTDFSVYGNGTQIVEPQTDENILRMILQAATMIVNAIDNKDINGYPGDDHVGKAAVSYIRAEQRRLGTAVV